MDISHENLVEELFCWYGDKGRKNLPWRKTPNPYKILIAELMLQKTHAIQQVLPVYRAFIKKYPDVNLLSKAHVEEVKEIIRSLGLQNTRSRRLIELAKVIMTEFDGRVPRDYTELIALPGVGEYVANAVLCMAFGKKALMADANLGRVLGRMFFGEEEYPPSSNRTCKVGNQLLPEKNCREFNLGIIDLGALVCTPISPQCLVCPISKYCLYFRRPCKLTP